MVDFKSCIKRSIWGRIAINELHALECWFWPKIYTDETAVRLYYKKYAGRVLDLTHPVTFSEKLQWYKLHHRDPLMQKCADKVNVRDYVISCNLSHILNEQYGVYNRVKDINIDTLPKQFVLKSSHGSNQLIIVKDKSKMCWWQEKLLMRSWLQFHIAWGGREWVYEHLQRRIIAEKYLEDETGELQDFKFFCFNGKPTFVQLERGRYNGQNIRNFYDMEWNLLPFGKGMPPNTLIHIPCPSQFEIMKEIAQTLSKPFQFVRVDLYQANNRVYFGELTFFPAGGLPNICPEKYDKIIGDYWHLID